MKRFFGTVAGVLVEDTNRHSSKAAPGNIHWMRHTHATRALQSGTELATVRHNLRPGLITTSSICLHDDDVKRTRQMPAAVSTADG